MSQAGFGNGCGCTAAVPDTTCTNTACINKQTINIEVDIWDDPGCDGDNVVRVYNTNDVVYLDGYFYFSLEDMNVDMPPTAKWSQPYTLGDMLKPSDVLFLIDAATGKAIIGTDGAGDLVLEGDCFITCNDLPDTSDHLTDTSVLPNTVQLGVDGAGSPVMGGDCLITCNDFDTNDFTIDGTTGQISLSDAGVCGAVLVTQAQVDAATSIKSVVCLTNPDGSTTEGAVTEDMLGGGSGSLPFDLGETVLSGGSSNCATLPAGTYYVKVDNDSSNLIPQWFLVKILETTGMQITFSSNQSAHISNYNGTLGTGQVCVTANIGNAVISDVIYVGSV